MKIDCHVHLVSTAPSSGCHMSWRMRASPAYPFLLAKFGLLGADDEERQRRYIERLAAAVTHSELDRAVLLAFDAVYAPSGERLAAKTHLEVPNDFVRDVCRASPEVFLYGASVHPYRRDALDELERVQKDGAVLVKLLPNSQGFDPADKILAPFYQKAAALELPLLIHAGFEHSVPPINQQWGRPERLRLALEEGAMVIVAHAGSAGLFHFRETFGEFLALLATYPRCYGDTSGLANFWRTKYLFWLLDDASLRRLFDACPEDPRSRLIHGSDYPLPVTPFSFRKRLPRALLRRIAALGSELQCDIELKRAVGLADDCLTRAYDELGIGRR